MDHPILPGATIGVLGSGQLGRMLGLVARRMGYSVATFSPDKNSPLGQIAAFETVAPYDDLDAVRAFAKRVQVVTFEFENVPSAAAAAAAEFAPVRPGGEVLHICQHRLREKQFLSQGGFPVAPHRIVRTLDELRAAVGEIGLPGVLKTAGFGYDGKGQVKLFPDSDLAIAWEKIGGREAVLEKFVRFTGEYSVVAARGLDGSFAHHGVVHNHHVDHILDLTVSPAPLAPAQQARAVELARAILDQLGVVGVLAVEFFLDESGELLVNELAPRPHNSGHVTIEGSPASQFEQQLRAVCGLPLGDSTPRSPSAMAQLLGDLWQHGEPDWAAALALPGVSLHLYGKAEARPGRKMGHLTALASTPEKATELVLEARRRVVARGSRE